MRPPVTLAQDASILLIRFSSIGDVLQCTSLPRCIRRRYPHSHIAFLTALPHQDLLLHNPHLSEVLALDRSEGLADLTRMCKTLRQRHWDLVVDLQGNLRSRFIRTALRAPFVACPRRVLRRRLLTGFGIYLLSKKPNREGDFLRLLAPWGVVDDAHSLEAHPEPVELLPAALAEAWGQLCAWRKEGRCVIGIAPGSAWPLKRWPFESFRSLAQRFLARDHGRVVCFGGPQESDTRQLAEDLGSAALCVVGCTLSQAARFASAMDAMVCNDSAALHLAEAVGVDVLAFFGATAKAWGYMPKRTNCRVLQHPLPCRPCTATGRGHCRHPWPQACLRAISVAEAETALHALLTHAAPVQAI